MLVYHQGSPGLLPGTHYTVCSQYIIAPQTPALGHIYRKRAIWAIISTERPTPFPSTPCVQIQLNLDFCHLPVFKRMLCISRVRPLRIPLHGCLVMKPCPGNLKYPKWLPSTCSSLLQLCTCQGLPGMIPCKLFPVPSCVAPRRNIRKRASLMPWRLQV